MKQFILSTIAIMLATLPLQARIKLVALPERNAVDLRFDHPNATLVEEERTLTLQEGTNHIDFSWRGVNLNPNSIRLKILSHPEKVNLISVSYPPNEDALVWNVYSEAPREEKVRISYLLQGIDRLVHYKGIATQNETSMGFKSYMILRNFSGEDFVDAECRLGYGSPFLTSIQHQETQRTLMLNMQDIPITKEFTWDSAKKPHDPEQVSRNVGIPVHYVIENQKDSGLGAYGLSAGKARIYQQDGHGSTIFLGEDRTGFVPVGDTMKLYIGDSRDVVVTQRRMSTRRKNIQRDDHGNIEVYDELIHDNVKIENFKDEAVTITVVEHIQGEWEKVHFSHLCIRKNHSTLEFKINLPAQSKQKLDLHYLRKNILAQRFTQYNSVRP